MAAGIAGEHVALEWLILADAAQVVSNKLYMIGGGWDVLTVNSGFPADHPMAVAASFTVPWSDTNQKHSTDIEIFDEDRNAVMANVTAEFEVGRAPGIPPGLAQRTQLAVTLGLRIEHAGQYTIRSRVNGEEQPRRACFRVLEGPGMALKKDRQ